MDNLALGLTKAIAELLESNEKRSQEQKQRLTELEKKVDILEKTCTNLVNENNKLQNDLTICKKQEEESRACIARTEEELKKLDGWTVVIRTFANQLNELKDRGDETDNKIGQLFEHLKLHQRHIKSITSHIRQPPTPSYTHRVTNIPRSLSSRFSNIPDQSSSPLHESLDDEAISLLSDQTEHLKQGIDALNDLTRSYDKGKSYYG